jgi:putative inorganic carbon (HCO3(-)) transporter
MQGKFLVLVWLSLLVLGARAPFVYGLGYLWVDMFEPQYVDPGLIASLHISLVMAVAALGSYVLADRRAMPGARLGVVLPIMFAVWVTLTTLWAAVPDAAWGKWGWASKTIIFSAFVPFVFRSRVQIEAAVLVLVLSIAAHAMAFGGKTLIGGGGYGFRLALIGVNMGLGESSTLAVDCIAILPLIGWLARHSEIVPPWRWRRLIALGLGSVAVIAALGTYARSGLIALTVYAAFAWWASKRKLLLPIVFAVAGIGLVSFMGANWSARMATILHPAHEDSAATRLAVWSWTWNYALQHPLGGGFEVYQIGMADLTIDGVEIVEQSRAFHSSYFEVLGEQGFVGAALFGAMILTFFVSARRIARRARKVAELAWMADLAKAMIVSAASYFAGAAFIGVAFQPFHYYLFGLAVALLNHYARATQLTTAGRIAAAPARGTQPLRA